ncbi:MAG TPA: TonB-dependent receptor plug domain-containing protein [Chitinophagaceae bacterium]|nr:TonB-dependent receptor plug domain-containing protein [Chitinophagaceae bacterium]
MKRIVFAACFLFSQADLFPQSAADSSRTTVDSFYLLTPVEVRAVRAPALAPFATTNISGAQLQRQNLGQDIPFLLQYLPSVVVNSDAGNGIGYTGIRIRGTDATRINVTLNGIPFNDAESQGTFFVDLPDFASSAGSVQVQRGVGTSSNGPGAFGASISFSTNEVRPDTYTEINNSFGSFNSRKHTVKAGTGLLNDHFTADLRVSQIRSDGYIDRAWSDLRSIHFTTAYLDERNTARLNIFSGKEKTYQAWYGISQEDLKAGKRRLNYAGTEKPGVPYDNETDNYAQDHYQLFFTRQLRHRFSLHSALFYTFGKGYYEQYKTAQQYADYGLSLSGQSEFVRQLWLDNDFYGGLFSVQYKDLRTEALLGGGYSTYGGKHFGELIWASGGLPVPKYRWYDLDARKSDFNVYLKGQTRFAAHWAGYVDLQYRYVNYGINGFRNNPGLHVASRYHFLNPRLGITFTKKSWKSYLSFAVANKEPNRDDFETGQLQKPKPERLHDLELGLEQKAARHSWALAVYYMHYNDQLILSGQINDVGAYTRTNVPRSYRAGVELSGYLSLTPQVSVLANLALSRNRVLDFHEFIDDYDLGGQKVNRYENSELAFSPAMIGSATLRLNPARNFEVSLPAKYVSRQYLDNTADPGRRLDPYFVQDLNVSYLIRPKKVLREAELLLQVNNLFNAQYESNGYTYSYIYGGERVVNNYYFPMAGTNFMIGLHLKF